VIFADRSTLSQYSEFCTAVNSLCESASKSYETPSSGASHPKAYVLAGRRRCRAQSADPQHAFTNYVRRDFGKIARYGL
jgi:hypothetical protein